MRNACQSSFASILCHLIFAGNSSIEPQSRQHGEAVHDGLHHGTAVHGEQPVQQKQERYIQHALAQNGADQRLLCPPHGLELRDHGVAHRHHGHGQHHDPQERRAVGDGGGRVDEQSDQRGGQQLIQ